jgi:hypothetical protein
MADKNVLEILLRASVDRKLTEAEVDKALKEVQGKVDKKPIKYEVKYDEKKMKENEALFFKGIKNIEKRVKKKLQDMGEIKTTVKMNDKREIQQVTAEIKKQNGEREIQIFQLKKIKNLQGKERQGFVRTSSKIENKLVTDVNKARALAIEQERKLEEQRIANATKEAKRIWKLIDADKAKERQMMANYEQAKKIDNQMYESATKEAKAIRKSIEAEEEKYRTMMKRYEQAKRMDNQMYESASKEAKKIREQIERERQLTETQAERITNYRESMNTRSRVLESGASKFMSTEQVESLNRWRTRVDELTVNTPNLTRRMNQLRNEFTEISGSIRQSARRAISFGDSIQSAFKKFAMWLGVGNALMGVINGVKEAFRYTVQLDTALTDLAKVTTFTTKQLNDMKVAAVDLGRELGRSSVDIMKSFAEFGRIRKTKEEIVELSRVNNCSITW